MIKLTLLNSVAPKLRPKAESLDAHVRKWYSDGYRTGAPGTNTCREDTDCNIGEICQSGYCAGLHRSYGTHGMFYGNEYKDLVGKLSTPMGYLQHGDYYRPHDFFYDYAFGYHDGSVRTNQPYDNDERETTQNDYGYI